MSMHINVKIIHCQKFDVGLNMNREWYEVYFLEDYLYFFKRWKAASEMMSVDIYTYSAIKEFTSIDEVRKYIECRKSTLPQLTIRKETFVL